MRVMLSSILIVLNAQKQYGLRGLEIMVEIILESEASSKENRQMEDFHKIQRDTYA
jgi:hypothetical protein